MDDLIFEVTRLILDKPKQMIEIFEKYDTDKTETWEDVIGWEGLYQISNLGRVKSLPRLRRCGIDNSYTSKEKIMSQSGDRQGYKVLRFHKGTRAVNIKVHRLIAIHFIPNPNNLPEVNHKNGLKDDNRIENLEWATSSGNRVHAFETGLQPMGERHPGAKLSIKDVRAIRKKYVHGVHGFKELAKEFGVTPSNIKHVVSNKTWYNV